MTIKILRERRKTPLIRIQNSLQVYLAVLPARILEGTRIVLVAVALPLNGGDNNSCCLLCSCHSNCVYMLSFVFFVLIGYCVKLFSLFSYFIDLLLLFCFFCQVNTALRWCSRVALLYYLYYYNPTQTNLQSVDQGGKTSTFE